MKFTCDQPMLLDALSLCIHAVSSKSAISALEGILVVADSHGLTLTGYNTQMGIIKTLEADVADEGRCVLPARIFFDIVRKLQGADVTIESDKTLNAVISSGKSVFYITGEDADEYPSLPKVNRKHSIEIKSKLLREMINDTIFAISTNENKPVHTGSLFEVENGKLSVISVDGYRLAVRNEEIEGLGDDSFSFIVPGSTLKEVTRILPDNDTPVSIFPDSKNGIFEIEDTIVTTRLLEGEFLNYRTAVPEDMPIKMTLSKSELISAVERVSLVISERLKNPVKCVFEDDLLKLSCTTALGRSYDEISIPFCTERVEIGFNNRYLLDALKGCPDDDFVLELKGSLSPALIKPVEGESFIYLILPVRLKADSI